MQEHEPVEYDLVEYHESAATFHARTLPDEPTAQIWHNEITGPSLVLGSTQRDDSIVDHDACRSAGVEVVRRRSGGGAVLLVPGEVGWIDVIVPTGSTGWSADVHRPMQWIGEHLAAIVRTAPGRTYTNGPNSSPDAIDRDAIDRDAIDRDATDRDATAGDRSVVTVNDAGMVPTPWSSLVCFDGVGPGEVLVDGRKLIGISQRRTRHGARLQCSWYTHHDLEALRPLLAEHVRPPAGALRPVATLDPGLSARLPDLLLDRLNAEPAPASRGE